MLVVGSGDIPSRHSPVFCMLLITACAIIFAKTFVLDVQSLIQRQSLSQSRPSAAASIQTDASEELNRFQQSWGFSFSDLQRRDFFSLLGHLFVHSGLVHLIANLWMLWAAGAALERALGSLQFAMFCIACGIVAVLAHGVASPHGEVPCVGADGAISGILGACLMLFGVRAKLKVTLWCVVPQVIISPVALFAVLWVGIQAGEAAWPPSAVSHLGWAGHLVGLSTGGLLGHLIRGELRARIRRAADGSCFVAQPNQPPSDREILERALAQHSLAEVVESCLGNRPVRCTACQRPLDVRQPLSGHFVRCQSADCGKINCVDADRLLSAAREKSPEPANELFDSNVFNDGRAANELLL
jgi:membrane associated rhomboid family serine protease